MMGGQNYESRGCMQGVGELFGKRQAVEKGRKGGEERKLNLVRRKIGKRNVNRQSVTDYKDREIEAEFC
jgi:hypothetical protein